MHVVVRRPRQLREQRYHQQRHKHGSAHRHWSALARRGSRRAVGAPARDHTPHRVCASGLGVASTLVLLGRLCGHGASLNGLLKKALGHAVGHGRFTMPSGDMRQIVRLVPFDVAAEVAGVRLRPHVLC
jgi:hypothetical protein